jgi:lipopolysaccharide transport system permease protein
MQHFNIYPNEILVSVWKNIELIHVLAKREIIGRYRGSFLGILWSFLNPVLLLLVYTFVFGEVFQAKWGVQDESEANFALVLFVGLIVFNIFADCITRSPGLILANANYVKKVLFPLDILSWVVMISAVIHASISFGIWIIVFMIVYGVPPLTALLLPLILVPFLLFTMGLSWFLSSLGTYFRDVTQVVGLLVTATMFLSPIFYPASSLPDGYRKIFELNPITPAIEMARNVLIWGIIPDIAEFSQYFLVGITIFLCGFAWFQKTRKGFADVL